MTPLTVIWRRSGLSKITNSGERLAYNVSICQPSVCSACCVVTEITLSGSDTILAQWNMATNKRKHSGKQKNRANPRSTSTSNLPARMLGGSILGSTRSVRFSFVWTQQLGLLSSTDNDTCCCPPKDKMDWRTLWIQFGIYILHKLLIRSFSGLWGQETFAEDEHQLESLDPWSAQGATTRQRNTNGVKIWQLFWLFWMFYGLKWRKI